MSKYLDFSVNLVTKLIIAIAINLCFMFPATAITQTMEFDTVTGYKVEAIFSYDEAKNTQVIREQGKGKAKSLDSLRVNFYQPSGESIASYDNIVDGMVTGNYVEFNYDPATKQILGNIDLGGESAGEMYLTGSVAGELSLIQVSDSGEENVVTTFIKSSFPRETN